MSLAWRDYWWLIFPLAAALGSGWYHWVSYRKAKATLETLKAFADSGIQPPLKLLESLTQAPDPGWSVFSFSTLRGSFGTVRRIVIWASLAVGFGLGSLTVGSPGEVDTFRALAIVFAVLTLSTGALILLRGRR